MEVRYRKLLAIGTLVSLGVAGFLLWQAAPEMSYYATPSAARAAAETGPPGLLRVGGTVKPGSLVPLAAEHPATFVLTDGVAELAVALPAELPALLREGQEAVAEGQMEGGRLLATRVFPRFDDPLKSQGKN